MPEVANLLVAVLVVALVWIICAALGLPYLISVIVTILAAIYVFNGARVGRMR